MKETIPTIKNIFYLIIISFALSSCEIINPSEETPFYLRIDSISFIDSTKNPVGPSAPGVHRIPDAWVYVDGIFVGAYEVPSTIPVLAKPGTHQIIVSPGIFASSQSNDRRIYPFFTNYKQTVNTELGKTSIVTPKVSYDPISVNYPPEGVNQFPEEFEGIGTIFKINANSKVDTFVRTSDPELVFTGNYSMLAELDATNNFLEFETDKAYSLPGGSRPVYLEVNYRTDASLNIGMYVIDNSNSSVTEVNIITMLPTNSEWKKLYLNLTSEVSSYSNSKYKIYFKANHNSGNTNSKVLIDNFRIMYK